MRLYVKSYMKLYVKFYVKLYVKVWCEWVLHEAICEGMMWISFMWSYMWRNDVNEFYVKLYVKEWCEWVLCDLVMILCKVDSIVS